MMLPSGNRCGHDPKRPTLSPAVPIRKGQGGIPRILSLAAERAKEWYFHPEKCPPLKAHRHRQTRSESREACQIVLETVLSHLDLASMCLGTPTCADGFIDIDMKTLVRDSGIGQRRFERAVALFKRAGFMKVTQPRKQNTEGDYFSCRAIRVVTSALFEWLGLGPMLERERRKASERLRRKASRADRKLSDLMRRLYTMLKRPGKKHMRLSSKEEEEILLRRKEWNEAWSDRIRRGMDSVEAQRRTNAALGYPQGYSPGQERFS